MNYINKECCHPEFISGSGMRCWTKSSM